MASVSHEGSSSPRPRSETVRGPACLAGRSFSWHFAVKVLFLATLGEAAYLERAAVLEPGRAYERIAARGWPMTPFTARAVISHAASPPPRRKPRAPRSRAMLRTGVPAAMRMATAGYQHSRGSATARRPRAPASDRPGRQEPSWRSILGLARAGGSPRQAPLRLCQQGRDGNGAGGRPVPCLPGTQRALAADPPALISPRVSPMSSSSRAHRRKRRSAFAGTRPRRPCLAPSRRHGEGCGWPSRRRLAGVGARWRRSSS